MHTGTNAIDNSELLFLRLKKRTKFVSSYHSLRLTHSFFCLYRSKAATQLRPERERLSLRT